MEALETRANERGQTLLRFRGFWEGRQQQGWVSTVAVDGGALLEKIGETRSTVSPARMGFDGVDDEAEDFKLVTSTYSAQSIDSKDEYY